jgi:FdhE protein
VIEPFSGGGERGAITPVRLPRPGPLFARRAERFAELARGHALSEYLTFLGHVAAAQAAVAGPPPSAPEGAPLLDFGPPHGPTPGAGSRAAPLEAGSHRRASRWRETFVGIARALSSAPLPDATRAGLDRVAALAGPELEALADRLLANAVGPGDLATGPFAAAALQAYFTALAARLRPDALEVAGDGCPACGSPPVVGVVLGDDKLRYLVCSLCATRWHRTRIQCAACQTGQGISYLALEGRPAARAEVCATCRAYTKLLYVESEPRLEPFADDVATLALDLLVAEQGFARNGVNLFLLSAEPALAA